MPHSKNLRFKLKHVLSFLSKGAKSSPRLVCASVLSGLLFAGAAQADIGVQGQVKEVLVTLTSAETQTQGMALVLSSAMQSQGANVQVLLCDSAGYLAVADHPSEALAPRNVSPQQMLKNLMQNGADIQVCALFLPNAELSQEALLEGVQSAQPPAISERMLADNIRVFNF